MVASSAPVVTSLVLYAELLPSKAMQELNVTKVTMGVLS